MKKTLFFGIVLAFSLSIYPQHKVRVASYNILNYTDFQNDSRNPSYKLVVSTLKPDILVVQEIKSQSAVNQFLDYAMGVDDYKAGTFLDGPDTDNALFYKDSLINFISNQRITTPLRDINKFTVSHKFTQDTLIIFSVHLKASEGSTNEQQRLLEASTLRVFTDNLPAGSNYIVLGDFNFYRSTEPAYQKLINQSTPGYFIDPSDLIGDWNNNSAYASVHSQSTRATASGNFTGGGLDDRFDMILMSTEVMNPGGIDYDDSSYTVFGNDGYHFNRSINEQPFIVVNSGVANALYNSSDHLPVYADFNFGVVTSVNHDEYPSASDYVLYQNYPNPFNPSTTINFSIPFAQKVKVTLHDLLGRELKILFSGEAKAGINKIHFTSDDKLSSGVYFYRLVTESAVLSKKIIIIK